MNVTTLIDVLLVLLIIFMVVVPSRTMGEKADIPLPPETKRATTPDLVVIQLHDSGEGKRPQLTMNRQPVAWDQLGSKLKELYLDRAERVAFVKGDPEIDFQYIAQAVDIARDAGATRVGLLGSR